MAMDSSASDADSFIEAMTTAHYVIGIIQHRLLSSTPRYGMHDK